MQTIRRLLILLPALWLVSVVQAAPIRQSTPFEIFLLNIRLDLEYLADDVMAPARPAGWTGNADLQSETFIADLWFDNELLANEIFGVGVRPPQWIGATTPIADILAGSIRHDLELSAAYFYGGYTEMPEKFRYDNFPEDWAGAERIYRCDRVLQNIVRILDRFYLASIDTPQSSVDYCASVSAEIEDELTTIALREEGLEALIPDIILAIRGDLERLADENLGLNNRPAGWIGNRDRNSPTLLSDNFIDLENLADNLIGVDERPPAWIGAIANSAIVSARNLRHDLELLADITLGENVRPFGWQGINALERCDPNVQNLVFLIQQQFNYEIPEFTEGETLQVYCDRVSLDANTLSENPPPEIVQEQEDRRFIAESRNAFAYLDVAALDYMGVMPWGTVFRAWYRNYGDSNMMFVSGDDFALWIDRRWTTMEDDRFRQLPTREGVRPLTFCDARWCNGPRATPTPTGAGPLSDIINAATPPATIPPSDVGASGKTQVSWNHVRVNYLLHRPDVGVAQVTLEICQDVSQIACEPVINVFNNNTGTTQPVISQMNGLNVYEFPYGYTSNLIIEGATLFSTDIWISDPTLLTPTGQ